MFIIHWNHFYWVFIPDCRVYRVMIDSRLLSISCNGLFQIAEYIVWWLIPDCWLSCDDCFQIADYRVMTYSRLLMILCNDLFQIAEYILWWFITDCWLYCVMTYSRSMSVYSRVSLQSVYSKNKRLYMFWVCVIRSWREGSAPGVASRATLRCPVWEVKVRTIPISFL